MYKNKIMKKIASQMKAKNKVQNDIKTEVESLNPKSIMVLDNVKVVSNEKLIKKTT